MKMHSTDGGWIITDKGVKKHFNDALDAWSYVFLMKEIRPHVTTVPKSLYPVKTLDPCPSRVAKKKVMI